MQYAHTLADRGAFDHNNNSSSSHERYDVSSSSNNSNNNTPNNYYNNDHNNDNNNNNNSNYNRNINSGTERRATTSRANALNSWMIIDDDEDCGSTNGTDAVAGGSAPAFTMEFRGQAGNGNIQLPAIGTPPSSAPHYYRGGGLRDSPGPRKISSSSQMVRSKSSRSDYLTALGTNESMMTRRMSIREAMLQIEAKEQAAAAVGAVPSYSSARNLLASQTGSMLPSPSHTALGNALAAHAQTPTSLMALAALVPRRPSYFGMRIDLMAANIQNEFGICGWILTILSYILIFFTLPISACMCIKVVQEYERAVIFRLGRLLPGGAKGPGIFFVVPCIDTYRKVDLRVLSFEVPPQEILSKDSVTVAVDAVVYFRISNATISVTNVEDSSRSTKLLAQTTLRNILGTKTLAEMLSDREAISLQMQATLDEATEPWGVKVERVEVKDVRLPVQLQRAMAAEAEAAREARAKVIVAEGEQKASRALKEAAEVIAESPSALQLRYLQTLNSISAEKNSTIIFPFPIDLLSSFLCRTVSKSGVSVNTAAGADKKAHFA